MERIAVHRFRATIEKGVLAANSWSFVNVPGGIVAALRNARRVRGTINGAEYDGALVSRSGGTKTLPIKRALRDALGLAIGQEVEITIEPDTRQRPIHIPEELAAALGDRPHVAKNFASLPPSHRREYADWIAQAKKAETRTARVERALEMIAAKRRLK